MNKNVYWILYNQFTKVLHKKTLMNWIVSDLKFPQLNQDTFIWAVTRLCILILAFFHHKIPPYIHWDILPYSIILNVHFLDNRKHFLLFFSLTYALILPYNYSFKSCQFLLFLIITHNLKSGCNLWISNRYIHIK